MDKEIKVLEIFAGVGGFRVGLEKHNPNVFKTLWANQWEPSRKSQDAFEVYNYRFPDSENINKDISQITEEEFKDMDADLIVGGFPCQDYSVSNSQYNVLGIEGKKGVLFWEIIRATEVIRPKALLLENVDRLLKSPTKQRGRDFAVMLATFNKLGYTVEWRVINAAEYGGAQRRRRIFMYVQRNDLWDTLRVLPGQHLYEEGIFAKAFPVEPEVYGSKKKNAITLTEDIKEISDNFEGEFWNSGIMTNGIVYSSETTPIKEKEQTIGDIYLGWDVPEKYFVTGERLERFQYLRGAKSVTKTNKKGHEYHYKEGSISPFDDINLPARTMVTTEGGINRSTHLLHDGKRYRTLLPIEAERLNGFPDDWTKYKISSEGKVTEVGDNRRLFFMGNAMVTDIVERLGEHIIDILSTED